VIWLASAAAKPSRTRRAATRTHGDAPRRGHVRIDRGEQQRPTDRHQDPERDCGHQEQREDLGVVIPRKLPKSSELMPLRLPR